MKGLLRHVKGEYIMPVVGEYRDSILKLVKIEYSSINPQTPYLYYAEDGEGNELVYSKEEILFLDDM